MAAEQYFLTAPFLYIFFKDMSLPQFFAVDETS
jgi:hypothetical protein